MKRNYFFPKKKSDKLAWTKNFKTQIATEGPKLNEPAADIAAVRTDCQGIEDQAALVQAAEENLQSVRDAANAFTGPAEKRILTYARRLKANPNYTDENGQVLWIVNTPVSQDMSQYTPKLRGRMDGGRPVLNFSMTDIDGMVIFGRTGGIGNYTNLGVAPSSPWYDNRPLAVAGVPELREFYGMAFINNQPVGQPSAVVTILFKG